jgi:hypothetical protein
VAQGQPVLHRASSASGEASKLLVLKLLYLEEQLLGVEVGALMRTGA